MSAPKIIDKAFILAAGLGTRMRPLTDRVPKPLVEVAGETLLDRTIDHLEDAGVTDIVINTHHLGQQIPHHLQRRKSPHMTFSHEKTLLDTGGGIKKMLQHFGDEAFYVLSGDGLWTDAPGQTALDQMAAKWEPAKMDILILLQPVSTMNLTKGVGDYDIRPDGGAVRSRHKTGTHMFTSIRINHPRIFNGSPMGSFSYLPLLDQAENDGRLFALEHKGAWHHISTPEDLRNVNVAITRDEGAA
jgi:MurNAc alpha-1-phosphate uridylyltransferase